MNKELHFIHPADVRGTWPMIIDGLKKVQAHSTDGWIPEDIYSELVSGNATLHVGYVDGDYAGFVVLQRRQGYQGVILQVWCAYSCTEQDAIHLFIDDLKTIARSINAREITFASPRRWERRLKPYGWKPVKTTYSMEV